MNGTTALTMKTMTQRLAIPLLALALTGLPHYALATLAGVIVNNHQGDFNGSSDDTYNSDISGMPASGMVAVSDATSRGTGFASVDLATGQLKVYSAGGANYGFDGSSALYDGEPLTFFNPALGPYSVGFTFIFHGSLSATPSQFAGFYGSGTIAGPAGTADIRIVIGNNPLIAPGVTIWLMNPDGSVIPNGATWSGLSRVSYRLDPSGNSWLEGWYDGLPGGVSTTLDLSVVMSVLAANGGIADYSHTGSVALDLPTGTSVTAGDPIFLSAVPEPTSAALLGVGLLALSYSQLLRRRRI